MEEIQPVVTRLRMAVTCPCGGEVLITLMSQIYRDARCSKCDKEYEANITVKEVAVAQEER
jgi:hypothetical protein